MRAHTFKPLKFLLPSRPLTSYNIGSPSCTPRGLHQLHHPKSTIPSPKDNHKMSPKTCTPEARFPYHLDQFYAPGHARAPITRVREAAADDHELARDISDLYKKIFVSPRGQLDRLSIPATKEIEGLKVGSSKTRGLHRPLDGLSLKLERFKIRTVRLGEVDQDEEKDQK